MRRDAKLGLALGMLVIGFAAAFCFPRQPRDALWHVVDSPPLEIEPELDFLPVRAYQPAAVDPAKAERMATNPALPRVDDPELIFGPAAIPTEPIPPVFVPPRNGLAEIIPQSAATPARPESPAADGLFVDDVPRTYRVRPGDTLSGIAARMLGSSQRYLELYEANRDRLSSPNDLRVNLELRIPGGDFPAKVVAEPAEADVPDSRPQPANTPLDPAADPRRFRRAEKVPFLSERTADLPLNEISPPAPRTHVVQPGETLEGIARKYFGDPRGVSQLQQANPGLTLDPRRLQPGTELKLR